jgi:hypothetical protein
VQYLRRTIFYALRIAVAEITYLGYTCPRMKGDAAPAVMIDARLVTQFAASATIFIHDHLEGFALIGQGSCGACADAWAVFAVLTHYRNVDRSRIELVNLYPRILEAIFFLVCERADLLADSATATPRKLVINIKMHRLIH